jgi:hypothetical protein
MLPATRLGFHFIAIEIAIEIGIDSIFVDLLSPFPPRATSIAIAIPISISICIAISPLNHLTFHLPTFQPSHFLVPATPG